MNLFSLINVKLTKEKDKVDLNLGFQDIPTFRQLIISFDFDKQINLI